MPTIHGQRVNPTLPADLAAPIARYARQTSRSGKEAGRRLIRLRYVASLAEVRTLVRKPGPRQSCSGRPDRRPRSPRESRKPSVLGWGPESASRSPPGLASGPMHRTGWWCKIGHVVVATRVLHGHRLRPVDIPDTGARNQLVHLGIGENVVQGPDATGELVARGIWIMFLDDLAKPGGLHSADRILHGISIEITKHKTGSSAKVLLTQPVSALTWTTRHVQAAPRQLWPYYMTPQPDLSGRV